MRHLPTEVRKLFNKTHRYLGNVIADAIDTQTDLSGNDEYTNLLRQIGELLVRAAALKAQSFKRN